MDFERWMKERGGLPQRRDGVLDAPVPGKPVPKSGGIGETPVAAPSPPPPASAPAPKSAGNARHGQSTTHREGSFPDFHGDLNYE